VQRFLLGSAFSVNIDTKGRVLVPTNLRDFAKIEEDIVFLGLSRYVEVWSKSRWSEHRGILEENIGRISEKLVPWEIKEVKHE
jgi:MraZ protein